MAEPKVSIIIPVHNVENYLEECLDSVINQTFKDMEIICINDGSTDSSLDILNSYANTDSRIRLFSQEQKGLGATRNRGLELATGKYVYFIDSDDYIYSESIEEMYEQAERNSSDLVVFSRVREEGLDRVNNRDGFNLNPDLKLSIDEYKNFTFTYKEIKRHVLNTFYNVFMVFYKKEFLDSFPDFVFQENLIYEDVLFHVKTFLRAERISYIPKAYYFYRKNPNSIMANNTHNIDIIKVIESVEDFLMENGYADEFKNELVLFKFRQVSLYLISAGTEEYFISAKNIFSKIELNPDFKWGEYNLRIYKMVLESNDYVDYLNKFYFYELETCNSKINVLESKLTNLKDENNRLLSKKKSLESEIDQIKNSRSLKITKPLRQIRNSFRSN